MQREAGTSRQEERLLLFYAVTPVFETPAALAWVGKSLPCFSAVTLVYETPAALWGGRWGLLPSLRPPVHQGVTTSVVAPARHTT